jgi:hypothetical protein
MLRYLISPFLFMLNSIYTTASAFSPECRARRCGVNVCGAGVFCRVIFVVVDPLSADRVSRLHCCPLFRRPRKTSTR